jgi:hypothetical protein
MSARRLRVLPDLGLYEIHVGALCGVHVGKLIVITHRHATIVGRLDQVPAPSLTKPLLVVELGERHTLALHPSKVVKVVPDSHKATVVVEPRE